MSLEIYEIKNLVVNKSYIGLTTVGLEQRWIQHRAHIRQGYQSGHPLYIDLADYGLDAFSVQVIGKADNIQQLNKLERQFIADRGTLVPNGYNLSPGGGAGVNQVGKPITYNGQKFSSHKKLARSRGILYETFLYRLKNGWTLPEAIGDEPTPYTSANAIPIEVDGVRYDSIAIAITALGLTSSTVYVRLSRNHSIEEAFGLEPIYHPLYQRVVIDKEHQFKSLREAASFYGVKYTVVKDRLRNNQRNKVTRWTVRQALGIDAPPNRPLPPKNKWQEIEYEDKVFPSRNHLARHLNLDPQLFADRLKAGYSFQKIIDTPVRKGRGLDGSPNSKSHAVINVENQQQRFHSVSDFAKFLGLSKSRCRFFLKNRFPFFGKQFCFEHEFDDFVLNTDNVPKICGCVREISTGRVWSNAGEAGKELGLTASGITQHCARIYDQQKFVYVCDALSLNHVSGSSREILGASCRWPP